MTGWFRNLPSDVPCFCVVGSPIAHSRSPEIHSAFAAQSGILLSYERIEVPAGAFAEALAEFVAAGGRGMNVTVPLKEEAYRAADHTLPAAAATGAANTIIVDHARRVAADNTDGRGLVRDLIANHGIELAGNRLLLLGAGGAARGVIPNLLEEAPAELVVVNRTAARAHELSDRFAELGNIRAGGYGEIGDGAFDVVLNATSLSLGGEIPPLPVFAIDQSSACYDMMYTADGRTAFLDWCDDQGAAVTLDGLGMLVEQAASAFALWHGIEPDTGPVISAMR